MREGNYLLHQEIFAKDESDKQQVELTKQAVNEGLEAYAREIEEKSTEFSPEMKEYISDAKTWHEHRFERLGLAGAQLSNQVYKVPGLQSGHGESKYGIIQVADLEVEKITPAPVAEAIKSNKFLPIEVTDDNLFDISREDAAKAVRQYLEALVVGHEYYHSAGLVSVSATIEQGQDGENIENPELATFQVSRQGAAYSSAGRLPAIEEGLAVSSEKEIEPLITEHFPLGAKVYQKLVDYVMEHDPRLRDNPHKDILRTLVSIRNFDGRNVDYRQTRYLGSETLVNYVRDEVPDFSRLVEEFRVQGKRLPLARAVEKRFGSGNFRKIFSATENNALSVMTELQKAKNN